MKRLLLGILIVGIIIGGYFGFKKYQVVSENKHRMEARQADLAQHNPELLRKILASNEILLKKVADNPNDSASWADLGTNYRSLGDYINAEKAWKKDITLDLLSTKSVNNLGVLYQEQKKYELAEAQFKELIKRAPGDANGYIRLAELYETGKYKKISDAETVLLNALGVLKGDKSIMIALGDYYEIIGDSTKSLEWFAKAGSTPVPVPPLGK